MICVLDFLPCIPDNREYDVKAKPRRRCDMFGLYLQFRYIGYLIYIFSSNRFSFVTLRFSSAKYRI